MTAREQQILALIRANTLISQAEIGRRLDISRSAVGGHIMRLTARGVIAGRGYVINDAPFVAAIGGANIDICGRPTTKLIMHDSNPGKVTTSPGGVARNIAENIARLGVECRLFTAVGSDHHGDLLLEHGQAAGIDMSYVHRSTTAPTSSYVTVLDHAGDMLVACNEMSITNELTAERLQSNEGVLKQASLIVADTNLPESTLAYLTETFVEQPLFVDVVSTAKSERIEPHLDSVHSLKASRIEAESISGRKTNSALDLANVAAWFHDRGVKRIFITLGEDGVYYSADGQSGREHSGNTNVPIDNVSGAGDAFVAGLVFAWLEDWPVRRSVGFAMSAAQIAMSHRATINPAISPTAVNEVYEQNYA